MKTKEPDTRAIVGARLRELRLEAGLTQVQLGEQLGLLSKSHISLIESGERAMSGDRLIVAAKIFNVHPTTFYTTKTLSLSDARTQDLLAMIVGSKKKKPSTYTALQQLVKMIAEEMDLINK